jgi:hypothetical protein
VRDEHAQSPPPLLAPQTQVFRASKEAGVRPLYYLMRTHPYYALRLTSADKAKHIIEFAQVRDPILGSSHDEKSLLYPA